VGGACGMNWQMRNVYRKQDGKRPLGRTRRTLKGNIKMDLLEIGLSVVD
jgi:hypothetical protein